MDKKGAEILLDETFNQRYDTGRFENFIRELFNGFNITRSTKLGPGVYEEYIKEYTVHGEYIESHNQIAVISVKLKRASSRDRARTMQRNFIAKYLTDFKKNAALVAFYGDDPEDWRFSFVKMEYQLNPGNPNLKTTTPVKRYSYLVGTHEPNHTCRSQFVSLLVEDKRNPSLEELEDAFSIEKVTKEFFEIYKDLFLKLRESIDAVLEKDKTIKADFAEKGISTIDFAKKLLGQIVFIYFLQKKGWLGVAKDEENGKFKEWGTGSKSFLRDLYEKKIVPYNNFFNDILEPLFYKALAIERTEHWCSELNCRIPFLNGGLFEPMNDYDWEKTKLLIANSIFGKILDTFDEFNFTVKEDEPLEKEVAVDPEMLGKVFENLLEVKDRKSKGAFYTPREIVHYMCQQSLINYLETNTKSLGISRDDIEHFIQFSEFSSSSDQDLLLEIEKLKSNVWAEKIQNLKRFEEKLMKKVEEINLPISILKNKKKIDKLLSEIKVVDPAVGSGAFPVGMMNEIVKARSVLSIFLSNSEETKSRTMYDLKRETIENCLYGVDIDSSAVDITKLRFWLSLIVDENDINHIKPLPNLDHKIMCGNSLLEEFEGVKLFDEKMLVKQEAPQNYEIELINSKIEELNQQLHDIHTGKIKDSSKSKMVKKNISELERKKKELQSSPKQEVQQLALDQIESYRVSESQNKLRELKKLQKRYFDASNKGVKDDIIKQIDAFEWDLIEETLKENGNEDSILKLTQYKKTKSKPFFLWKLYFADVFARENPGFDVVIANPPYVNIYKIEIQEKEYYFKSGKYKSATSKFDLYVLFMELSVNLLKKEGTSCFITSNKWLSQPYGKGIREVYLKYDILKLINFNFHIFGATVETNISILRKSNLTSMISILNLHCEDVGSQNENDFITNNSKIASILNHGSYLELPKSIFAQNEELNFRLNLTEKKLDLIKKIELHSKRLDDICYIAYGLRGNSPKLGKNKDYFVKTSNKGNDYVRYFEGKDIKKWSFNSNRFFDYSPELHYNSMFPELFESDKLVSNEVIGKSHFRVAFDVDGRYNNHTVINIVKYSLLKDCDYKPLQRILSPEKIKLSSLVNYKYILALLNSSLTFWYFKELLAIELHFYPNYVKALPIIIVDSNTQLSLENLVDKILKITNDTNCSIDKQKQLEVKLIEREIDQLIYNLYKLTLEEIEMIESFNLET